MIISIDIFWLSIKYYLRLISIKLLVLLIYKKLELLSDLSRTKSFFYFNINFESNFIVKINKAVNMLLRFFIEKS